MPTSTIDRRRAQLEQLERVRDAGTQRTKTRERARKAEEQADGDLADALIAARGTVEITELARTLGLTRKAVYDLIAWREGRKPSRH